MAGDYTCEVCKRGLYHWQIRGMDPDGQPLCEVCARRPDSLTPKEQYRAWYGFLRRYRDAQESESADTYPIGFDCPDYGHCEECYCTLSFERDLEIRQIIQSMKVWLPALVAPTIKEAAQRTFEHKHDTRGPRRSWFFRYGNGLGFIYHHLGSSRKREDITWALEKRQELGSWERVWKLYPGAVASRESPYLMAYGNDDKKTLVRRMLEHYPQWRAWYEQNRPHLLEPLPWEKVQG